jgi:hypothetical protein
MKKCCERDYDNDGNCDRHPERPRSLLQIALDGTDAEFEAGLKKWYVRGWRRVFRGAEGGK